MSPEEVLVLVSEVIGVVVEGGVVMGLSSDDVADVVAAEGRLLGVETGKSVVVEKGRVVGVVDGTFVEVVPMSVGIVVVNVEVVISDVAEVLDVSKLEEDEDELIQSSQILAPG